MAKKLIIFDMDGTLVNTSTQVPNIHAEVLQKLGFTHVTAEFVKQGLGESDEALINRALSTQNNPITTELVQEKLHSFLNLQHEVFRKRYIQCGFHADQSLIHFLRELSDVSVCIASNAHSNRNAEWIDLLGLKDIFKRHAIYGPDNVNGNGKPKPDMLQLACTTHQVTPDNALMIGDTLADMKAAKAAGIESILISQHTHDRTTLSFQEALSLATHHTQSTQGLITFLRHRLG